MIESAYRYVAVMKGQGGSVRSALPGDFLPCYEDLLYSAVAEGTLPNDGLLRRATVEPLWDGGPAGKIRGVEIRLPPLAKPYPLAIFADPVRALWAERCQAQGVEGAPAEVEFSWHIETEQIPAKPPGKLQARLSRAPYPFLDRSLASFGIEARGSPPPPVFVSQALFEGLRQDTAESLEAERADLLIGYLARDGEACPAVIATERVPALADADPSPIRFTFSPHAFLEAADRVANTPMERRSSAGIITIHRPAAVAVCNAFRPARRTRSFSVTPIGRYSGRAFRCPT